MKVIDTYIDGLKIIETNIFCDNRGKFIKVFNDEIFNIYGFNINIREVYYSISHKNVIRGMHFQIPPYDHVKLVYVPFGKIIDVVLDLRKKSNTFCEYYSCELSSDNGKILIIPKGFAHGFKSLENNTIVSYMQTSCYVSESDLGIRYDSFGFNWECEDPIISERDRSFVELKNFDTPF